MADVTGGPVVTNASPFAVPTDLTDLKDHFGDAGMFSVANVVGLPASGNWTGRALWVQEDSSVRRWNGSAWKIVFEPTRQQLDTTNSTVFLREQVGMGKITGDNTAQIEEVVTFPVAFSSVPYVFPSYIGFRDPAGAFNPVGLTAAGAQMIAAMSISTTGFMVRMNLPSGTWANTRDWYYQWIAKGEV